MKVPDPKINSTLNYLKAIAKSGPGELADTIGMVLTNITSPLAAIITLRLAELDEERIEWGRDHHKQLLQNTLNEYGIVDITGTRSLPNLLIITLDDNKTIAISILKHLGQPIGYIGAISDIDGGEILTLPDAVWVCTTHISNRIHSILAPNSPIASQILGRQVLTALRKDGIKALAIGSISGSDSWVSLSWQHDKIAVSEIEHFPQDQAAAISDGEIIGENTLKYLWFNLQVAAGVWVSGESNYYLALAFDDRKLATRHIAAKVREFIENKTRNDTAYLAQSFEKLKTDFKKLIKSERVAAITETTVTINHEINNPLTAILGNTQLMLMSRDKLPADIVSKLETIERSAIKIRETTTKLMSIIDPVTTPYASGLEMIDIDKSKKKKTDQQ